MQNRTSGEILDHLIEKANGESDKPEWSFIQWALLAVLILIVASWVYGITSNILSTRIKHIHLTDVHIIGSSNLCPGDKLVIGFYVKADGTGKLIQDATVRTEYPPKTIIFSESLPYLVDGTLDQEQTVAWPIPFTFIDPETAVRKNLSEGTYRRIFSISSATDENQFGLDRVIFNIRKGCPTQ